MNNSDQKAERVLARVLSRELTNDELALVSGGEEPHSDGSTCSQGVDCDQAQ